MSTLTFGGLRTAPAAHRSASLGLFALVAREWSYFAARRSMAHLDDAALHDMGLGRSEIDDVVRHGRSPAPRG